MFTAFHAKKQIFHLGYLWVTLQITHIHESLSSSGQALTLYTLIIHQDDKGMRYVQYS